MMTNAREYAWSVLCRVMLEHGYASLMLRNMPQDLSRQDRGLVTELVYGTLRTWKLLEYQRKDLVKGPVRPRTAVLLNLSVYQILYLSRVPAYAAIDEACRLAPKRERGFVNAVLRRIAERKEVLPPEDGTLERLSIVTSHPLFVLNLWKAHYGEETAREIAFHNQLRPQIYGRLNTLKAEKKDIDCPKIHWLSETAFRYEGVLSETEWFQEGLVLIQDYSSQMPAEFLDVHPGMRVLDVCAAPGTKTQQIACLMEDQGEITAMDLYQERTGLMDQLMERTGVHIVRTSTGDAAEVNRLHEPESFDRVLADVPCSGLGDLSHKPEIRYHVTPESIDDLIRTQKAILHAAGQMVKPGGILVYSTCTLNRKENEGQVQKFLKENPAFSLIRERTVFPMMFDSDGFYMAALSKNAV